MIPDSDLQYIFQALTAHARLGNMLQYCLRFLTILFSSFDQSGFIAVIQPMMNLE